MTTKNDLSAVSAFPESVLPCFKFTMPEDCPCADFALLLADRLMRWFEDFDPYGTYYEPRSGVLLQTAAALMFGDSDHSIRDELAQALEEFEDDEESYLFLDGKQLSADVQSFCDYITFKR